SEYPAMKASSALPPDTNAENEESSLPMMLEGTWWSIAAGLPRPTSLSLTTASAYMTVIESMRLASADLPAPASSSTFDNASAAASFCGERSRPHFESAARNSLISPAKAERASPASKDAVPFSPSSSARNPASMSDEPGQAFQPID